MLYVAIIMSKTFFFMYMISDINYISHVTNYSIMIICDLELFDLKMKSKSILSYNFWVM